MTPDRLQTIISRLPSVTIAVVGDFFLDRYLVLESTLTEKSLETGLDCYQIVAKRHSPGAAGTVTSNLRALGVGRVLAVGVIGDDGEGFELRRGLDRIGVEQQSLLTHGDLFTPTYTKPMLREGGKERELNRLDVKNRAPMPRGIEDAIIQQLERCVSEADAVIVADQVQERNFGVVTDRLRETLAKMAAAAPGKAFFVDSRARIGEFRNMILKPNRHEAVAAVDAGFVGEPTMEQIGDAARELMRRTGRPICVTLGEKGILLVMGEGRKVIPGVRVEGEIDIVGAGDSTTAGIVSALCAGASLAEAALIGNIVASITIQQIGTTGTATPDQVMQRFRSL